MPLRNCFREEFINFGLSSVSTFRNLRIACLFQLWSRFRKTFRAYRRLSYRNDFLKLSWRFRYGAVSKKLVMQYLFFFFGMLLCYILGTAWLQRLMSLSFYKALSVGVLPFIIPDCIKVVLAFWLGKRLKKSLYQWKSA